MKTLITLLVTLMLVSCSSKTKIHVEDGEGGTVVIEHEQEKKK